MKTHLKPWLYAVNLLLCAVSVYMAYRCFRMVYFGIRIGEPELMAMEFGAAFGCVYAAQLFWRNTWNIAGNKT